MKWRGPESHRQEGTEPGSGARVSGFTGLGLPFMPSASRASRSVFTHSFHSPRPHSSRAEAQHLPATPHLHEKGVREAGVSQQDGLLIRNATQDEHRCLLHRVPQRPRRDIDKVPGYQTEDLQGVEGREGCSTLTPSSMAPSHLGEKPKSSPDP